jgi:short-subunit dehydrogenase
VTTVLPGFTRTEFQRRAGIEGRKIPGPLWQSAEAVATEALDAARSGKPWHITGRHNQALVAASALAPRRLKRWLAARATKRL